MVRGKIWIALLAVGYLSMACLQAFPGRFGTFNPRTNLFRRVHTWLHEDPVRTRLPVVLAHGICGWDVKKWGPIELRYFHGIEAHLKKLGVQVLTTDVPATGGIEERARFLAEQIRQWTPGQVNIIAHSMGGLDARYMISHLGMADRVATLTMVSTPNQGTLLSDWLNYWGSDRFPAVERFVRSVGIDPEGFKDLSVKHMTQVFNPSTPDDPRVSYRSLSGKQSFHKYFAPLMATHALNRALEKTLARQKLGWKDMRLLKTVPAAGSMRQALSKKGFRDALRGLPSGWLKPELVGKTDGMVSMSSAWYGHFKGWVDADHLDQMGWLTAFDSRGFYEKLVRDLAAEGF